MFALAAAPAAIHTPIGVQGRPRIEPLDDSEAGRTISREKKGRRDSGQHSLGRDARVVVSPANPRPWVFEWLAHGKRAPPSTPPPAATPPPNSYFELNPAITPQARDLAVAVYYLETMDSPPECEDNETVSWIVKHLRIPKGSRSVVKKVIEDARRCYEAGVEYTGKKTESDSLMLASIQPNSVAAFIIAGSMEDGSGIRRAHQDAV